MDKLIPVKSCVLVSGCNANGEQFNTAKITIALDTNAVGVISVAVAKAGALPASWKFEVGGFKPSVSKVHYEKYDDALRAFVEVSSEDGADRVERLIALGYVGVVDADLAKFSVIKTEIGKNGQKVCHLRRTTEGNLRIRRLPFEVEEAGLCLL